MPEHHVEHDVLRSSPVTHAEIEALPLWGRVAFAARCARGAVNALAQKEQRVDERLLQSAVYAVIIAEQLSLGLSKWSVGSFAAVLGGGAAAAARAALAAADDAVKAADAEAADTARAAAYAAAAAADAAKAADASANATSAKAAADDVAAYAADAADAAANAAYAYATFIQQRETYAALKRLMEGLDFTAPVSAVWFLGIPSMAAPAPVTDRPKPIASDVPALAAGLTGGALAACAALLASGAWLLAGGFGFAANLFALVWLVTRTRSRH